MPAEIFGANYSFLPRENLLTFEEIERLVQITTSLGVRKVRLTGGEPLLRRNFCELVTKLAKLPEVDDLAVTTNGALLAAHAAGLHSAGLKRITVSLDALEPETFAAMNGVGAKVSRVVEGIEQAQRAGLRVKVNSVIQRGVNEHEIMPLVEWCRERDLILRFIEFMDVGETNAWRIAKVVPAGEIRAMVEAKIPLVALAPTHRGEVAQRYGFRDGSGEIGFITSITQPFCQNCTRLRVSAEGRIFTCLFANEGHDLRSLLRSEATDDNIAEALSRIWLSRTDRYSEMRGQTEQPRPEMSYMGG